jgi:hypothetical protein
MTEKLDRQVQELLYQALETELGALRSMKPRFNARFMTVCAKNGNSTGMKRFPIATCCWMSSIS